MKISVSYDAKGKILTMFDPDKLAGDKGVLTYVPAKGEVVHTIEVPHALASKDLSEIHKALRVTKIGAAPTFEHGY